MLAVSVHQDYEASPDVVFGCELSYEPIEPLEITNQPASLVVHDGEAATFSVGVSGSFPTFQWYFKEAPIPGAITDTYTISSVARSQVGTYFMVASNVLVITHDEIEASRG